MTPTGARHRPAARGIPAPRTWSRLELVLAGVLLSLATVAWWVTGELAMPEMRSGLLTGMQPMGPGTASPAVPPAAFGFFLLTWLVMMAAMMLPAVTPFMVGLRRLLGPRAGGGTLSALTVGYLLVWGAAGVLGYAVVRVFEAAAAGGGTVAVRVGAGVLVLAGGYQFTPWKHRCLARCRSPLALVMRYAETAVRSPGGGVRVGARHGGYCLGCCWALMAVLLAVGVMSLAWMAAVAAVITVEKVAPRAEPVGRALGAVLVGLGAALLWAPGLAPAVA